MFWRRWHPSLSGENTCDCLPHKSKGSTLWEEWRTPPQMASVHGKIHVISVWCCTKMEFPASEDFLTIYICGIYPTSWKQLFYHPLYCCIPWCRAQAPAHSAFLTRLHLPALWSSSRHRAELTQAHQHLSCRGPPEPEEILRMWWVVSAELVGNKHFPWPTNSTWPVSSCITIFVFQKLHELQCIADFFLPSQVRSICWSRNTCILGLSALHQFLKPRNCLIFDRHYLLNTTCEWIGLHFFTLEMQVLKSSCLRKDKVENTAVCFCCKKPSSVS